jgi:hypothetical protein
MAAKGGEVMQGERTRDRRKDARVHARGRVAVDGHGRGKIIDVSTGGVRFRVAGPLVRFDLGDQVDLELRFDGAEGGWWRLAGRVVRNAGAGVVVVAFAATPTDFEDWMHAELLAELESEDERHVMLVDPIAARRGQVAATLRESGRTVAEAATPLDAIDRLGESRYRPRTIAVADTVPARVADELRAYLLAEHADIGVVRMMSGAR